MHIQCPHCGFSKDVDSQRMPPAANRVTCPKCQGSFALGESTPAASSEPSRPEEEQQSPVAAPAEPLQPAAAALPKAGFWIRVVATLVDAALIFILQFLLGAILAAVGLATNGANGNLAILIQLFGYLLSAVYAVVFTGYCGQTPGKMALRIKVIRRDGRQISYGRAAFREIPAKFLSGILFGIGYLMVAFDDQKQGLHDRLADTYVIKL